MCEIVKLPGGGSAFMCGGHTKDHECNENGAIIILDDGSRLPQTDENMKLYGDRIRAGSVACDICGHASIDEGLWAMG